MIRVSLQKYGKKTGMFLKYDKEFFSISVNVRGVIHFFWVCHPGICISI